MFCPECGKQIIVEANFCKYCGADLRPYRMNGRVDHSKDNTDYSEPQAMDNGYVPLDQEKPSHNSNQSMNDYENNYSNDYSNDYSNNYNDYQNTQNNSKNEYDQPYNEYENSYTNYDPNDYRDSSYQENTNNPFEGPAHDPYERNTVIGNEITMGDIGFGVLSFLVPLVGLVLYGVYRQSNSTRAICAIFGAALGFFLNIMVLVFR